MKVKKVLKMINDGDIDEAKKALFEELQKNSETVKKSQTKKKEAKNGK